MGLIELYLGIALSAAITSLFSFYLPAIKEAKLKGISNLLTESQVLGALIFLGITTVLAPFVFYPLISPIQAERFRVGLQRAVEKPDE